MESKKKKKTLKKRAINRFDEILVSGKIEAHHFEAHNVVSV